MRAKKLACWAEGGGNRSTSNGVYFYVLTIFPACSRNGGPAGRKPKTYRHAATRPNDGALLARLTELACKPPLRLPAYGADICSVRGPDQSEQTVPALQEERLIVRKRSGGTRALSG